MQINEITQKVQGAYRRGNDHKDAKGNEAKVDDQSNVEVGEVAEWRHLLPIGVHQVRPGGGTFFQGASRVGSSHVEQHEQADGSPDGEGIIGDEEGEVGDGDEEEGRNEGGYDDAVHPPRQVQLKPDVGVVGGAIVACLKLVHLKSGKGKYTRSMCLVPVLAFNTFLVKIIEIDGVTYYANSMVVAWQVDFIIDVKIIRPAKVHLLHLVAEGLQLDGTILPVHWVLLELHVAADVEVDPLGKPHNPVLVNLDGLRRIVKLWLPEARDEDERSLVRSLAPDLDGLVNKHVRLPDLLDVCRVLGKTLCKQCIERPPLP